MCFGADGIGMGGRTSDHLSVGHGVRGLKRAVSVDLALLELHVGSWATGRGSCGACAALDSGTVGREDDWAHGVGGARRRRLRVRLRWARSGNAWSRRLGQRIPVMRPLCEGVTGRHGGRWRRGVTRKMRWDEKKEGKKR